MTGDGALLTRVRAERAAAEVASRERRAPDARAVVDLVRRSFASEDPAQVLALWDEAGTRHDPETLDAALVQLTAGGWVPFVGARGRRRLRDAARLALRSSAHAGTVELAVAVLGATGSKEDAQDLETLALHPAFTLHAATALSNLAHWQGRAALLRLLGKTDGAARVIVIDRLLPHFREPAVRLALVRDALLGLPSEYAAEVAADIAALCDVKGCLDDPKSPEDVRAGARLVLAAVDPTPKP